MVVEWRAGERRGKKAFEELECWLGARWKGGKKVFEQPHSSLSAPLTHLAVMPRGVQ